MWCVARGCAGDVAAEGEVGFLRFGRFGLGPRIPTRRGLASAARVARWRSATGGIRRDRAVLWAGLLQARGCRSGAEPCDHWDLSMRLLDYPGSSAASMRSAQKPSSMQRSFENEKERLAANGALWVIRLDFNLNLGFASPAGHFQAALSAAQGERDKSSLDEQHRSAEPTWN